jgi:hypothetical protein
MCYEGAERKRRSSTNARCRVPKRNPEPPGNSKSTSLKKLRAPPASNAPHGRNVAPVQHVRRLIGIPVSASLPIRLQRAQVTARPAVVPARPAARNADVHCRGDGAANVALLTEPQPLGRRLAAPAHTGALRDGNGGDKYCQRREAAINAMGAAGDVSSMLRERRRGCRGSAVSRGRMAITCPGGPVQHTLARREASLLHELYTWSF